MVYTMPQFSLSSEFILNLSFNVSIHLDVENEISPQEEARDILMIYTFLSFFFFFMTLLHMTILTMFSIKNSPSLASYMISVMDR